VGEFNHWDVITRAGFEEYGFSKVRVFPLAGHETSKKKKKKKTVIELHNFEWARGERERGVGRTSSHLTTDIASQGITSLPGCNPRKAG